MFYRDTWAEVDLEAIKYNIKLIFDNSEYTDGYAVVKANAYGHGVIEVSKAVIETGITNLAVASLDEALEIRQVIKDPKINILIFGAIRSTDLEIIVKNNLTITIYSTDIANELIEFYLNYKEKFDYLISNKFNEFNKLKFHVKIDTGMNRIGIKNYKDIDDTINKLEQHNLFELEGIYTHFATADETDNEYLNFQVNNFKNILNKFDLKRFKYIHSDNSAAVVKKTIPEANLCRLGYGMYGLRPMSNKFKLKQALSLKTKVIMLKSIRKGEKMSYGATYAARDEEEIIATLPIGYADGLMRSNQNRKVLINNKKYNLIGRICMDQCMVRVDKDVKLYDTVEIYGQNISLVEISEENNTIPCEIVCTLSPRVPILYKNNS